MAATIYNMVCLENVKLLYLRVHTHMMCNRFYLALQREVAFIAYPSRA